MSFAILKYQFVDSSQKPAGIPDEWPAYVLDIGESNELPGEDWTLMTQQQLSDHKAQYQSTYTAWESSYYAPQITDVVTGKIQKSIKFGNKILVEFAMENVLLGITQSGKTASVVNYLTTLRNYVATGSLYAALTEIDMLIADPNLETNFSPFITVARLSSYRQKIVDFLSVL